jgi:hypothetical protein
MTRSSRSNREWSRKKENDFLNLSWCWIPAKWPSNGAHGIKCHCCSIEGTQKQYQKIVCISGFVWSQHAFCCSGFDDEKICPWNRSEIVKDRIRNNYLFRRVPEVYHQHGSVWQCSQNDVKRRYHDVWGPANEFQIVIVNILKRKTLSVISSKFFIFVK